MDAKKDEPRRRLSDLLLALDFCEIQLEVLLRSGRSHHARELGVRVAALHGRMDQLERAIRARAAHLLDDATLPMSELRRQLAPAERRQLAAARDDARADRRRGRRRGADRPADPSRPVSWFRQS